MFCLSLPVVVDFGLVSVLGSLVKSDSWRDSDICGTGGGGGAIPACIRLAFLEVWHKSKHNETTERTG